MNFRTISDVDEFSLSYYHTGSGCKKILSKSALLACFILCVLIVTHGILESVACLGFRGISLTTTSDLKEFNAIENPEDRESIEDDNAIPSNHSESFRKFDSTRILIEPTYSPGNLTVQENGLLLSSGLKSRIIAKSGKPVAYVSGLNSTLNFHRFPDFGATFDGPNGTWIYVSNSEIRYTFNAGVGALTFNSNGEVIDYKMVQSNSRANCGGGKTPWQAWISGEEYAEGELWQVDPTGARKPENITMGSTGRGSFESFSYDVTNASSPRFFATQDWLFGALRRFTPNAPNWSDPWRILLGEGDIDYLVLRPALFSWSRGTYSWVRSRLLGRINAGVFFPFTEGINVKGNELFFISKLYHWMYILNLDDGTYRRVSTTGGLFDGQPDQIVTGYNDTLYFTEDGGRYAGVHARDSSGRFITILEGISYTDETTGLAFSPNKKHMYVAFQDDGVLFDITRADGLPLDRLT